MSTEGVYSRDIGRGNSREGGGEAFHLLQRRVSRALRVVQLRLQRLPPPAPRALNKEFRRVRKKDEGGGVVSPPKLFLRRKDEGVSMRAGPGPASPCPRIPLTRAPRGL